VTRGVGARLDVAREHAASETIRRRIAHYFDAAARDPGGPTIVVGLPPGSRHELGAFAFAVAARRAGLDSVYLGADVPIDAWRQTVRDTHPVAAVVAVVARADVPIGKRGHPGHPRGRGHDRRYRRPSRRRHPAGAWGRTAAGRYRGGSRRLLEDVGATR
jgi:hypothetical protein